MRTRQKRAVLSDRAGTVSASDAPLPGPVQVREERTIGETAMPTIHRYSPWADLTALGVTVEYDTLRAPRRGYWDPATRTVVLHAGLLQDERRCTLAHELIHVERGDDGRCASSWHESRLEQLVHALAARRLIALADLRFALALSRHEHDLAEELWVDRYTLQVRLATLTGQERRTLDEPLSIVRCRLAG